MMPCATKPVFDIYRRPVKPRTYVCSPEETATIMDRWYEGQGKILADELRQQRERDFAQRNKPGNLLRITE